mmetsp:Transcript_38357/g.102310  ORF Transcript_38357/g.102310 Transcript_38357/m.102310 type:complete len:203 (+) Transcript_38357:99-707(+)
MSVPSSSTWTWFGVVGALLGPWEGDEGTELGASVDASSSSSGPSELASARLALAATAVLNTPLYVVAEPSVQEPWRPVRMPRTSVEELFVLASLRPSESCSALFVQKAAQMRHISGSDLHCSMRSASVSVGVGSTCFEHVGVSVPRSAATAAAVAEEACLGRRVRPPWRPLALEAASPSTPPLLEGRRSPVLGTTPSPAAPA